MINRGAQACCPDSKLGIARRRVFCSSLSDWLDNETPIEWLVDLLDTIRQTPNLDWLLLTKRIGNWEGRIEKANLVASTGGERLSELFDLLQDWMNGSPPANVWIGATVVNQVEADRDIPKLLRVPARVRFLSVEPMLGEIDLNYVDFMRDCPPDCEYAHTEPDTNAFVCSKCDHSGKTDDIGIDWVICGGESGPNARPMHPDWVRSLRRQCQAARIPFLFKQWGAWEILSKENGYHDFNMKANGAIWLHRDGVITTTPLGHRTDGHPSSSGHAMIKAGNKKTGRLLDGMIYGQFPKPEGDES